MADLNPETSWDFAETIQQLFPRPNTKRPATVQSVDTDGTIWVSLPGSSRVTPIKSTGANVSPGDTVLTELRGNSLHITVNQSDPAIGESRATSITRRIVRPVETEAKIAKTIADEAQAVADATAQHFFSDDNGAHITDVTQDEWTQAVNDNFSDYDPTTKPYHNQLLNSLGILLRTALNNLVSITRSAIAFYDGTGNAASNIVARFGSSGAQIGKSSAAHSVIDADGQRFFGGSDGSVQLANIGYGEGASASGTAIAPYYTFGERLANSVIGNYSHAEGTDTTASEFASHAEGDRTTASGADSHAEGRDTTASGDYSHAEGYGTTASGENSHAEGDRTTASGFNSHAEGTGTVASKSASHAEGRDTTASGAYSHAGGRGTIAAGNTQTAVGTYNLPDNNNKYVVIVGNGASDSNRSNAFTVDWEGNVEAGGRFIGPLAYGSYYGYTDLTLTTAFQNLALSTFSGDGVTKSGNGVRIDKAGVYLVLGSCYCFTGYTANDIVHLAIYQNSNAVCDVISRMYSANPYQTMQASAILACSAGDVIKLSARNQTGARGTVANRDNHGLTVVQIA